MTSTYAYPRTVAEMIPARRAELARFEVPSCSTEGHGPMAARPLETQTYERMFCGIWYGCETHGCDSTVLFKSREMSAQHGEPYFDGERHWQWGSGQWWPMSDEMADGFWEQKRLDRERLEKHRRSARRAARATAR